MTNGVFTRSSKRPAIHVYFEYICWTFAGSCKHPISLASVYPTGNGVAYAVLDDLKIIDLDDLYRQ